MLLIPTRTRLVGCILWTAFALTGCGAPLKASDVIPAHRDVMASTQPATFAEALGAQKELDELRASIARQQIEADAKIRNNEKIIDACRWLGMLLIVGGAIASWLVDRKLGFTLIAVGASSLALGIILNGPWFKIASGATAILGMMYGAGAAYMKLKTKWETNQQAASKRRLAESTRDGAEAAVLIAEANVLEHVGTPAYNARVVEPGTKAVAMIEEAVR